MTDVTDGPPAIAVVRPGAIGATSGAELTRADTRSCSAIDLVI